MLRCVSARCARTLAPRSRSRRCSPKSGAAARRRAARAAARRAAVQTRGAGAVPLGRLHRRRSAARLAATNAQRHEQAAEQDGVGQRVGRRRRTAGGSASSAPATATAARSRRGAAPRRSARAARLRQAAERLLRRSRAQDLVVLLEQPRRRALRDLVAMRADRVEHRRLDREVEPRGERDRAEHADRIFAEPDVRVADRADDAGPQIVEAADVVDDREVAMS